MAIIDDPAYICESGGVSEVWPEEPVGAVSGPDVAIPRKHFNQPQALAPQLNFTPVQSFARRYKQLLGDHARRDSEGLSASMK